jgi:hypothetical protein
MARNRGKQVAIRFDAKDQVDPCLGTRRSSDGHNQHRALADDSFAGRDARPLVEKIQPVTHGTLKCCKSLAQLVE